MRFGPIAVALLTVSLSASAADPFVGTWKPNVEKWKIGPGFREGAKSETITIEANGKNEYRFTRTTLDGKPSDIPPETAIIDGKEHKSSDNGNPVKVERIDERHLRATVSGSKGTAVNEWVVSPDGKTLMNTRKGTGTGSGRPLDEFLVYSKK